VKRTVLVELTEVGWTERLVEQVSVAGELGLLVKVNNVADVAVSDALITRLVVGVDFL